MYDRIEAKRGDKRGHGLVQHVVLADYRESKERQLCRTSRRAHIARVSESLNGLHLSIDQKTVVSPRKMQSSEGSVSPRGSSGPLEVRVMKRMRAGRWEPRVLVVDERGVTWAGAKKAKCVAIADIVAVAPCAQEASKPLKGCSFQLECTKNERAKVYVFSTMSLSSKATLLTRLDALRYPGRLSPRPNRLGNSGVSSASNSANPSPRSTPKSPRRGREKEKEGEKEERKSGVADASSGVVSCVVEISIPRDAAFDVAAAMKDGLEEITSRNCKATLWRGVEMWEVRLQANSKDELQRGQRSAHWHAKWAGEAYRGEGGLESDLLASRREESLSMRYVGGRDTMEVTLNVMEAELGKLMTDLYQTGEE